jgi:uncharacterized protein
VVAGSSGSNHEFYLFGGGKNSHVALFFAYPLEALGLFRADGGDGSRRHILGRKADIMTRRSLHPALRERIEVSALQVF